MFKFHAVNLSCFANYFFFYLKNCVLGETGHKENYWYDFTVIHFVIIQNKSHVICFGGFHRNVCKESISIFFVILLDLKEEIFILCIY